MSSAASTRPPPVTFNVPLPRCPTTTAAVVPLWRRSASSSSTSSVPVLPRALPTVIDEAAVKVPVVRRIVPTSPPTSPTRTVPLVA
jgi:hypothetical protein